MFTFAGNLPAQNPVASFTYEAQQPPSTCIQFTDSSGPGIVNYLWSFHDATGSQSTQQNPLFCYPDTGCYNVHLWVQDINGNTDSITQTICIHGQTTFFIPNAFTPNGDGKNDLFFVYGVFIPENKFEMRIYDYWGGLVFYSDDPDKGWDGRAMQGNNLVQDGAYRLELIWSDVHNEKHTYKGAIFLYK